MISTKKSTTRFVGAGLAVGEVGSRDGEADASRDHDFISGNIFLSNNNQPNPWYTHYATYGDIINEQGTLSIISSYQPHAVPPNHLEQNRYSCAFDVYMNNEPENIKTDMYTHYVK